MRNVALICAAAVSLAGPAAAQSASNAALEARVRALEGKVQRLQDIHDIEKLTRAYGYYLDKKLWTEIGDLWSAAGTVEIAGRGVYKGKASITTFFRDVLFRSDSEGIKEGNVFNHMILQGIVDVDPDGVHAKARWRAVQTLMINGKPIMAEGPYENTYVKENGVWKFDQMHYFTTFDTDLRAPFAEPMRMNGPNEKFPPDAPPTIVFDSFPGVYIPPFHYPNPVSGRPWPAEKSKAMATVGKGLH